MTCDSVYLKLKIPNLCDVEVVRSQTKTILKTLTCLNMLTNAKIELYEI